MATQSILAENPSIGSEFPEEAERIIRYTCLSNRVFELIVFPTEQCNFRCTYCYEDFSIGRMAEDAISGIKCLIERKAPTLERLKLGYFGSEPLLNMKAIRDISGTALSLKDDYGFVFTSDMTMNGFLLDQDSLKELVDLGCTDYQISLDGWSQVHDETRRQRNRSGSFERIWRNLLSAKETDLDFRIILRVHMSPANAHSLPELIDNINSSLCDDRFSVLLKPVGNWGGTSSEHPEVFRRGSKQFIELYERLMASIRRSTSYGVDETGGGAVPSTILNQYGGSPGVDIPTMCYASRSNSYVIRANGRINKCTVALQNPANDIGHIGADGSLNIDAQKLVPWLGGVASLDRGYLGCPASKVIFGK